jgi:nucleotide-binding universal stress UspA family protein
LIRINGDGTGATHNSLSGCEKKRHLDELLRVANDLYRRSSVALERTVQLAVKTGAVLDVLHVIEDDLPAAVIDRRPAGAKAAMSDELSALPEPAIAKVETVVPVGKDYTDILGWAETSGADLNVLGVHREDALRSVVIGITAERIIGFGSRPVLIAEKYAQQVVLRGPALSQTVTICHRSILRTRTRAIKA